MKFLSDILAKAGLVVDGVVTLNNTATGQTPDANDNSTKLATTAWVRTFVQPYSLPIASASVLGGIKVGNGLSIDATTGVLTASGGGNVGSFRSKQVFTATASQTTFTVSGGYTPGFIDVFINGVYINDDLYTATNSSTIVLDEAAALDDIITVFIYSPFYVGESPSSRDICIFTATAAQTTFSCSYVIGSVDVFYNGSKLAGSEFNASNGTTVVLNTACDAGDFVEIISWVAGGGLSSSRTITIDGVTQDLTANRTWNVIPTGGAAGDILAKTSATNYAVAWIPNYTDARARAAISLTTTETAGLATYDSGTGVLNIPNYGSVLTNYVPYTGATDNVNLGTYGLVSDYLQLNTSPTSVPSTAGTMAWNDADGTLDIKLKGGNVTLQVGQETLYEVRNERGTTIPNGTAVYANGVTAGSSRITVDAYIADGSIRENRFLGLATEDISNGVNGFVTHFGYVRGLDTRGTSSSSISVGDETWAVGDILYVHPTVAGKLTNVKPQHEITVAIIITRHQSSGVLFVRPSSAGHLEDIHDISISSPSNGDILQYVSSTGLWTKAAGTTTSVAEGTNLYYTDARSRTAISLTTTETSGPATYNNTTGVLNIPEYQGGVTSFNTRTGAVTLSSEDVTTALTYTPVTNARTLSINGTTYDLTANRSWTVGVNPSARTIQTFTATANQTTFTITGGYIVGLVDVFINGVRLTASDFTATNGTTVVLTTGTGVNNIVDVIKYTSAFIIDNALRQTTYFTATAGQTTFTVSYSPGLVDVFYNGSKLPASEYTASNGTSIVLTTPAILNDTIEVTAYNYTAGAFTGQAQLNGTGFVKVSGTTVSYDNSTYLTTSSASSTYLPLTGGILTGTTRMDGSGGTTPSITMIFNSGINRLLAPVLRLYGATNESSNYIELFGTLATSNRTINFPDASGTVALTSNLSGYLPLTGGTLTGSLGGTTAAFSGNTTIGGSDGVATRLYVRTEDTANTPSLTLFKNINASSTEDVFRVQSFTGGIITTASIRANGSAIFRNDVNIAGNGAQLLFDSLGSTRDGGIQYINDFTLQIYNTRGVGSSIYLGNNNLDFNINPSTNPRLRITSLGNVLINTTTDNGSKLYVNGASYLDGYNYASSIQYTRAVSNTVNPAGGNGVLIFSGGQSAIRMNSSYTMNFDMYNGGNQFTALQIRQTGNTVQVNSPDNSLCLALAFGGVEHGYLGASGSALYAYSVNGGYALLNSSSAWVPGSDIKRKRNFEPYTKGLSAILGLEPKLYNMDFQEDGDEKQVGLVAQEVRDFIPHAYEENADFIGLNYNAIIVTMVKAIQEQQEVIESLKSRIENLEQV
jgi:hypothetical protein